MPLPSEGSALRNRSLSENEEAPPGADDNEHGHCDAGDALRGRFGDEEADPENQPADRHDANGDRATDHRLRPSFHESSMAGAAGTGSLMARTDQRGRTAAGGGLPVRAAAERRCPRLPDLADRSNRHVPVTAPIGVLRWLLPSDGLGRWLPVEPLHERRRPLRFPEFTHEGGLALRAVSGFRPLFGTVTNPDHGRESDLYAPSTKRAFLDPDG